MKRQLLSSLLLFLSTTPFIQAMNTDEISLTEDEWSLRKAACDGDFYHASQLIKKGTNINAADCFGDTPLHLAADHGHIRIVRALVTAKASLDNVNHLNFTPLHLAVSNKNFQIAEILITAGACVNAVDSFGITPLHFAVMVDHVKIAMMLVAAGANTGMKDQEGRTWQDIVKKYRPSGFVKLLGL